MNGDFSKAFSATCMDVAVEAWDSADDLEQVSRHFD